MLLRFLHIFFGGPNGIVTAGVPLIFNGSPYLLKAKLRICLSDGAGIAQALEWRGAGSIKPCIFNSNVLKRDCKLIAAAGEEFVEIGCFDTHRFRSTVARD